MAAARTLWGNEILGQVSREYMEIQYGMWCKPFLEPNFKDFLFKYVQGKVYLNHIRANFEEVSPKCTFCLMRLKRQLSEEGIQEDDPAYMQRIETLANETTRHIFWDCVHTVDIIRRQLNELRVNRIENMEQFLIGRELENRNNSLVLLLVLHFIKWQIWRFKIMFKYPSFASLNYELDQFKKCIRKHRILGYWVDRL